MPSTPMMRGKNPGPIRPAAVRHSRSQPISVYAASSTSRSPKKTVLGRTARLAQLSEAEGCAVLTARPPR
jgi:hypothetical protein